MPKVFDDCVAKGGKVRTISMGGGKYRHVCYGPKGSKPALGYVKKAKGGGTS